jgi:hypothetical protein
VKKRNGPAWLLTGPLGAAIPPDDRVRSGCTFRFPSEPATSRGSVVHRGLIAQGHRDSKLRSRAAWAIAHIAGPVGTAAPPSPWPAPADPV